MRIISTFKDYYDCMARYDDDYDTILLRKKEEVIQIPFDLSFLEDNKRITYFNIYTGDLDIGLKPIVIFFAGKAYPFLKKIEKTTNTVVKSFIFDKEEALSLIKKNCKDSKNIVNRFFDYFNKEREEFNNLCYNFGPIFGMFFNSHNEYYLRINDRCVLIEKNIKLEDYGFHKFLPPYIAYNELRNFVYNMSYPSRPIPEMPNDIKIHQAGFDLKTSFRKKKKT
jgi:hypothetical protein